MRTSPFAVRISSRPATSPASTGEKGRDSVLALFGFQRAGTIHQHTSRPEQRSRLLQQALLQRRQGADVVFLSKPANIRVSTNRPRSGAGRIYQNTVKTGAVSSLPLRRIGHDRFR